MYKLEVTVFMKLILCGFGMQCIMELESSEPSHNIIYVDEAGFNLTKSRRRGRHVFDHRATVDLPGQQGGDISISAAISKNGVLTHIPRIGPYNTQHLLNFLETLNKTLIPDDERGPFWDDLPKYGAIWDNVRFHHSHTIRQWFATHYRMLMEFLPPYSPFLNPMKEFYLAWRWKIYIGQPLTQMTLLHSKILFPCCIAR